MHKGLNKALISVFIGAIVLVILTSLGLFFHIIIIDMLMSLGWVTFILLVMYIKFLEDPEGQKQKLIQNQVSKSAEMSRINGIFAYRVAKIMFPVFLIIGTALYIGFFVSRMIEKVNRGLIVYNELTFVLGILLCLALVVIVVIGIFKKERIFSREHVRKYAYLFLDFLVSMLLIVK